MRLSDLRTWARVGAPCHVLADLVVFAAIRTAGPVVVHASAPLCGTSDPLVQASVTELAAHPRVSQATRLSVCPPCREEPQVAAVHDLVHALLGAATSARVTRTALGAEPCPRPSSEVLNAGVLTRRGLHVPNRHGHLPGWAALARHTSGPLHAWWANTVPQWQDQFAQQRSRWRHHQSGWGGPLHLVAPLTSVGGVWAIPSGAAGPAVAFVADLVGTVPAPTARPVDTAWSLPVFALPAAVSVDGRLWVSLGPPRDQPDLAALLAGYTALLSSGQLDTSSGRGRADNQALVAAMVHATA